MKSSILIFLCIIMQTLVQAQNISNGLYINKSLNEFICVQDSNIQLRLHQQGDFDVYSIGNGKYSFLEHNRYRIFFDESALLEQISTINYYPRNDSLTTITVLNDDNSPVIMIKIFLYDTHGNNLIADYVAESGQLILSLNFVEKFNDEELVVNIESISFSAQKNFLLKKGYNHVIKSVMPSGLPFSPYSNKVDLQVIQISEKDLVVNVIHNVPVWVSKFRKKKMEIEIEGEKTILKKIKTDCNCSEFLLNKNVIQLIR